jgi:hypothetical protein
MQAYRIDHILGFFRIWEIPGHGVSGLLGRFSPAVPLTRTELEAVGIWDIQRLTQPYITDTLLASAFGAAWRTVVRQCIDNPIVYFFLRICVGLAKLCIISGIFVRITRCISNSQSILSDLRLQLLCRFKFLMFAFGKLQRRPSRG